MARKMKKKTYKPLLVSAWIFLMMTFLAIGLSVINFFDDKLFWMLIKLGFGVLVLSSLFFYLFRKLGGS